MPRDTLFAEGGQGGSARTQDDIAACVSPTGQGHSDDEKDRIFEKFEGPIPRRREASLGLYIAAASPGEGGAVAATRPGAGARCTLTCAARE